MPTGSEEGPGQHCPVRTRADTLDIVHRYLPGKGSQPLSKGGKDQSPNPWVTCYGREPVLNGW